MSSKKTAKSAGSAKGTVKARPGEGKPSRGGVKRATGGAAGGAKPRPSAKSTVGGRPRIRASHSEGGTEREMSDSEAKKRRARAKATVRSLDTTRGPSSKRPLPMPTRDGAGPHGAGPRSGPAKRRSGAPQSIPSASQELALALAAAGLDKKAIGVEVIDVSGRVDYADYLVIMTGTSDRHVHAIAMGLEEALKRKKQPPISVEGLGTAAWVLMDFGDVVVHVFQEDTRRIYDIEGLWMDASRVSVPGPGPLPGDPSPPRAT